MYTNQTRKNQKGGVKRLANLASRAGQAVQSIFRLPPALLQPTRRFMSTVRTPGKVLKPGEGLPRGLTMSSLPGTVSKGFTKKELEERIKKDPQGWKVSHLEIASIRPVSAPGIYKLVTGKTFPSGKNIQLTPYLKEIEETLKKSGRYVLNLKRINEESTNTKASVSEEEEKPKTTEESFQASTPFRVATPQEMEAYGRGNSLDLGFGVSVKKEDVAKAFLKAGTASKQLNAQSKAYRLAQHKNNHVKPENVNENAQKLILNTQIFTKRIRDGKISSLMNFGPVRRLIIDLSTVPGVARLPGVGAKGLMRSFYLPSRVLIRGKNIERYRSFGSQPELDRQGLLELNTAFYNLFYTKIKHNPTYDINKFLRLFNQEVLYKFQDTMMPYYIEMGDQALLPFLQLFSDAIQYETITSENIIPILNQIRSNPEGAYKLLTALMSDRGQFTEQLRKARETSRATSREYFKSRTLWQLLALSGIGVFLLLVSLLGVNTGIPGIESVKTLYQMGKLTPVKTVEEMALSANNAATRNSRRATFNNLRATRKLLQNKAIDPMLASVKSKTAPIVEAAEEYKEKTLAPYRDENRLTKIKKSLGLYKAPPAPPAPPTPLVPEAFEEPNERFM